MAYHPLWIIEYQKAILVGEQQWYYLTHNWGGDKGFHTFPKSISPKVNILVLLEFETILSQPSIITTP